MEISKFDLQMKYLAPNGVTLNNDEQMNIGLALHQLQAEMNFEECLFWGKVEGKYFTNISRFGPIFISNMHNLQIF